MSPRIQISCAAAVVALGLTVPEAVSAQSIATLTPAAAQAGGALQSAAGAPEAEAEPAEPEAVELKPSGFLKGRFLVGATVTQGLTPDRDLGSAPRISPFIRTTPRRQGWGPSFGLNWTTTDVYVSVNGERVAVGSAKLRPVMLGVSYSINRGRLMTSIGMVGGYAFNDARLDHALPPGYHAELEVKDAWVMRPHVGLTYALARRFALVGSLGYVVTNPEISIRLTDLDGRTRTFSDTFRSHYVVVSMGAAFSIF